MWKLFSALVRERLLGVLLFAALMLLALAALRPRDVAGLHPDVFWARKISWRHCADIVLAGDSRTCSGVSPRVVAEAFPGQRILNFSFDNVAFSPEYLAGVEAVLDPASRRKVVVLGLTPHSLTGRSADRFGFVQKKEGRRRGLVHRLRNLQPVWLYYVTEPIPLDKALSMIFTSWRVTRHERKYWPDGWVASRLTPERPEEGFAAADRWYKEGRAQPWAAEPLLEKVKFWRAAGIAVFGFRPPTSKELAATEDRLSGFDEAAFARRFEAAGGRWLAFPSGAYHTYDSSHLDREAAVAFSRALGRSLVGGGL